MKKYILLSLLLAFGMAKANAYTEVPGFDGPTWYDYIAAVPDGVDPVILTANLELSILVIS